MGPRSLISSCCSLMSHSNWLTRFCRLSTFLFAFPTIFIKLSSSCSRLLAASSLISNWHFLLFLLRQNIVRLSTEEADRFCNHLGDVHPFALFVVVMAGLESAGNPNNRPFSTILARIFRSLPPKCAQNKIGINLTILVAKVTIYRQRYLCHSRPFL